jgi:hypothetical protein
MSQPVVTKRLKAAIVSVEMGYGHLRPAQTLSDFLETPIWRADHAPFATAKEELIWSSVRQMHEALSKVTQLPGRLGETMHGLMNLVTRIDPLHSDRDFSTPTAGVLALDALIKQGVGSNLVRKLRENGAPLLTTYYATAIIGDRAGLDRVYCVVTDSDINRVWAPVNAASTHIFYFAPSHRVFNRLRAYGVPENRIGISGFPLPVELLGDEQAQIARQTLAGRLVRLDPSESFTREHYNDIGKVVGALPSEQRGQPPLLTFAVGGAGAQHYLSDQFLSSLREPIIRGRLRLVLVAGTRRDVNLRFEKQIDRYGLRTALGYRLRILFEPDFVTYYRKFNQLLAETDILWTKPSELSFYAALGIPLILATPLGIHEMYNRRWLIERGAALDQRPPALAVDWLFEWLNEGVLANAAWAGFNRLPKTGTYQIAKKIEADSGYSQ